MHPVQLHELLRLRQRLLPRGHLDQRIAADDLLRLGKRAIGRLQLAAAQSDPEPLRGGFSPAVSLRIPLLNPAVTNSPIASISPCGISSLR